MTETNKRNLINQEIMANLLNITEENGYEVTVKRVDDDLKHWEEVPPDEFPCLFVVSGDESYSYVANNVILSVTKPLIIGYVKEEIHVNAALDRLIFAVRKMILGANKTQGGNACVTYIDSVTTDRATLIPWGVFNMSLRVEYRESTIS